MKPITPFDNFPSFANGGSRSAPGDAKYALGFVPADTFPAEWANYFFHGATKGVSDLNSAVYSLWNEMGSVLANYNITPDATDNDQLLECLTKLKAEAALAAHPVGSLYWTASTENPATTFGGGTWTQIKDKFILAAGDTYTNGATGGSASVTLTEGQMPSHEHSFTPSGNVASHTHSVGAHNHGLNSHTHSVNIEGSTGLPTSKNDLGVAITQTGGMSANATGTLGLRSNENSGMETQYATRSGNITFLGTETNKALGGTSANKTIYKGFSIDVSHTHNMEHKHKVLVSGSTGAATGNTANSTAFNSGSTQPSFTGTAGTTGAKGGGQAHNNMPPYIVKYCWQRTA